MLDLLSLRADTPGAQHVVHFNNAGASLMPKPVIDAITDHIALEAEIGGYEAADARKDAIRGFYTSTAELLNTTADNIAAMSSATDAYAQALSAIPFERGNVILTTINDYVSNQIAFLSLKKRFGVEVVRAADEPGNGVSVEDMAKKIKSLRPKLVAVTHVPTNSGLVQPVEAIGQLCRENDVLYLVDACQSVGQLPVDVTQIRCDFLTATCRKFLRGPRGTGFLYVSDKALSMNLAPLFIDLHGASWESADTFQPIKTALRFENWEFPYALVLGAAEANRYALNVGIETIAKRNEELCGMLRSQLSKVPGVRLLDEGQRLASIITLFSDRKSAADLKLALKAEHINTSLSPHGAAILDFDQKGMKTTALRISPHYFNTEDEINTLVDTLKNSFK
ncbi:aminotransferase class V-fold PLP-dependent enzyme [Spirosoma sp. KCTC 42546]|uniref:aminotransferase class V-fold PLP-dependent enzyme n=1 Tax=Spirosoma sp. KCTC 42546 TaxID=2520506 RepID=UPI00115A89D6|nr:aminotransferase class V-fold PLP-dependent enzyme [Spirosoma sp. KCTC 42546]QDK80332.1 aminotransferase class V-fold PLP-dependent enzyme [Spirosoma sp. KCTC 42546]